MIADITAPLAKLRDQYGKPAAANRPQKNATPTVSRQPGALASVSVVPLIVDRQARDVIAHMQSEGHPQRAKNVALITGDDELGTQFLSQDGRNTSGSELDLSPCSLIGFAAALASVVSRLWVCGSGPARTVPV